jgi:tetratricopeptide (TPR) repeat protein
MRRFKHVCGNLYELKPLVEKTKMASYFFYEGQLAEEKYHYDEALVCYERCLECDPRFAVAWVNSGTIFYSRKEFSKAAEYYRLALDIDPKDPLTHFNLGNALEELRNRQEAIKHYLAATRLAPGYADAHYNLAFMHGSLNNDQEALKHWRFFIKYDDRRPWANYARQQIELLESQLPVRRLSLVRTKPFNSILNKMG